MSGLGVTSASDEYALDEHLRNALSMTAPVMEFRLSPTVVDPLFVSAVQPIGASQANRPHSVPLTPQRAMANDPFASSPAREFQSPWRFNPITQTPKSHADKLGEMGNTNHSSGGSLFDTWSPALQVKIPRYFGAFLPGRLFILSSPLHCLV